MIMSCKTKDKKIEEPVFSNEKWEQRNTDFLRYMENEENPASDLKRIVRYGKDIFPLLEMTLDKGPSVARVQTYELQLIEQYNAVFKNNKSKAPFTQKEYVKQYLDKFILNYKLRAVEVLDNIPESKSILTGYLEKSGKQEEVLRNYIKEVLETK